MSRDHELTFCADVAGWMNEVFAARPELPFSIVKIEQSAKRSRERRDLTIYDRAEGIAITVEVKLPYMADGHSPFNDKVVDGAVAKALRVGAPYFVTWNVNRLVLWKTDDPGKRLEERSIHDQRITQVRDADDLAAPAFRDAVRRGLTLFLERAAQAYKGELPLGRKPLDTFFISVLEAGLERPILTVQRSIEEKYANDGKFKVRLDRWMRDVQSWHLSDDELIQRDNLERAAKFSCYVLVNKIVFYLAMRRRWSKLKLLRIPSTVTTADRLRELFGTAFTAAMRASRDYETIFRGDFADELPFDTDAAVPAWRGLLDSIERFDFTKLNYDVIGPIFERLISPEERHRYGQHYTKPEVVDLINAFCIRDPAASVMDPACGGGTFLVRAYARKKYLAEKSGLRLSHTEALDQLFGTDISAYAAHLTTMNLATRDLIDDHNYPLVAQKDFFDLAPGGVVLTVPLGSGGALGQKQPIYLPELDAVVGNPPYVRQEEISVPPTAEFKRRVKITATGLDKIKKEQKAYKAHLAELASAFAPNIQFSGRSDLHVYFWPHVAKFLKPHAYYGFLTSSGWLDVDYGFRLQEFILRNFAVLAIFESQLEPWFTGARVTTCATILRREPDEAKRRDNLVRFVQIRSFMADIFPPDQSEEQRQLAADALRARIESLTADATDPHWRVRVVRQGDLWDAGVRNAMLVAKPDDDDGPDSGNGRSVTGEETTPDRYYGSKWGIHLRAPDLYFELAARFRDHLVPLNAIARIRRGVTTGCDKFFFVRDVTKEHLEKHPKPAGFKNRWGIQPFQTDRIRIVRSGDGSDHLVEAKFLEPEVHNLMETNGVFGVRIDPDELRLKVFLCGVPRSKLKGTHALRYVEWGEKEGFHEGTTCASRAASGEWYDLRPGPRGDVLWPMAQQYRHLAPLNDHKLVANHNLFDVHVGGGVDAAVLCGVLNSTLVALHKHLFGRWAGTEGNLKTEVVDVKMMPVPDARQATRTVARRIRSAVDALARRRTRNLTDEFDDPARLALDDAVLELLGVTDAQEREAVLARLYAEMIAMHRAIRDKELRAIENKKRAKRGGAPSPESMAAEIWGSLGDGLLRRFPEDFLGAEIKNAESVELLDGKARIVPRPLLGKVELEMGEHVVELAKEPRAALALAAHQSGRRGPILVPRDPQACTAALLLFRAYRDQMHAEFTQRTEEKTGNEKLAAKAAAILEQRLGRFGNPEPSQ
ncbi:MAG: N-6 DNA methylase [Planctomycetales bacterium]